MFYLLISIYNFFSKKKRKKIEFLKLSSTRRFLSDSSATPPPPCSGRIIIPTSSFFHPSNGPPRQYPLWLRVDLPTARWSLIWRGLTLFSFPTKSSPKISEIRTLFSAPCRISPRSYPDKYSRLSVRKRQFDWGEDIIDFLVGEK